MQPFIQEKEKKDDRISTRNKFVLSILLVISIISIGIHVYTGQPLKFFKREILLVLVGGILYYFAIKGKWAVSIMYMNTFLIFYSVFISITQEIYLSHFLLVILALMLMNIYQNWKVTLLGGIGALWNMNYIMFHNEQLFLLIPHFDREVSPVFVNFEVICMMAALIAQSVLNHHYRVKLHRNLIDRRRMEESLKKSEERYRGLIDLSPDAIVVHQKGMIIFVNDKGLQLMGAQSQEEVIGKRILDIVHPEDHSIVKGRVERMLEEGCAMPLQEIRIMDCSKQIRFVEISASPILFNKYPAIQVIARDITEKKKMEKALENNRQRFQILFEKAGIGIGLRDSKRRLTEINPMFQQMLGYSKEELLNQSTAHLVHPDDLALEESLYTELLDGKRNNYQMEKRYFNKDGQMIWTHLTVSLFPCESGEPEAVIGMLQDITDRKKAEEALRDSESRYRFIAENSTDFISQHDNHGSYVYASPVIIDLLGYDVKEMIGNSPFEFIHPDDQQPLFQLFAEGMNPANKMQIATFTYRMRKKSGEYAWMETTARNLSKPDGPFEGFIAVSRDISKRKELEEHLKETNQFLLKLSSVDGLTGLWNRRAFDETLEKEWKRAVRFQAPLSLLMIDVDYFKSYNDTYGHLKGDDCLRQVAQAIQLQFQRATDMPARYGGEEFAVILPDTDEAGALLLARTLRKRIEDLGIPHEGSKVSPYVTCSIGAATIMPGLGHSWKDAVDLADKALYHAKQEGRNKVNGVSFIQDELKK